MYVSGLIVLFSALIIVTVLRRSQSPYFITIVSLLLYFGALMWGYREVVVASFSYQGFEWQPRFIRILGSLALLIGFGHLLPRSLSKPSDYFMQFWFIFAYVPLLASFALGNADTGYVGAVSACLASMLLLQKAVPPSRMAAAGNKALKARRILAPLSLVVVTVIVYSLLIRTHGFRWGVIIDDSVYELRAEYAAASAARAVRYLTIWQGYVVNPIILGVGLKRRNVPLVVLSIVMTLLLVSITGTKNFLTGIALMPMIVFLVRSPGKSVSMMALGLANLVGLSTITYYMGDIQVATLGIRRLLFTPVLVQLRYFRFFSHNPKAMLGHGFLSLFVRYPYDLAPAGLIARLNDPAASSGANAGFLGDAYANFGFVGMLAFSFLLILVLRFADGLAVSRGTLFVLLPLGMPFFALINSALLTTLLTHGMLFGLAMGGLSAGESNLTPKLPDSGTPAYSEYTQASRQRLKECM